MNAFHLFGIAVVLQVTVVTAVVAILIVAARRHAAFRDAAGTLALGLVLASPLLVLVLPASAWQPAQQSADLLDEQPLAGTSLEPQPMWVANKLDDAIVASVPEVVEHDSAARIFAEETDRVAATPTALPGSIEKRPVSEHVAESHWLASFQPDWSWWFKQFVAVCVWLWLAGATVLIARHCWLRIRVRKLRQALQASPAACAESLQTLDSVLNEARIAVGLQRVPRLTISNAVPMPMIVGLWRSVIVLPADVVASASAARLRDVLIHECAHLVRRDPWTNAAQRVAGILFWFHPGVNWLNRQLARSREEICDNFVLRHAQSADYAQTLLDLAEQCSAKRVAIPALGILTNRWTLEDRIASLLNPNRVTVTRTNRLTMAALVLVLAAFPAIVGGVRAVETPSATATVAATDEQGSESTEAPPPDAKTHEPAGEQKPATNTAEQRGTLKKISIHGTCVDFDSDFELVSNVRVRVFRYVSLLDPPLLVGEVTADADGAFAFHNIETAADRTSMHGVGDLVIAATREGFASTMQYVDDKTDDVEMQLTLSSNPGTLSGVVTDTAGRPVKGANVFFPSRAQIPISNIWAARTGDDGHFVIADRRRWQSEDSFDQKTGTGSTNTRCVFLIEHSDFARTQAWYSAIPSQVNVTLMPAAIVEGRVIDEVTSRPAANVVVSAQGVVDHGWFQTRTDGVGRYRLAMTKDHYNIWAEMDDRIAVAAKALPVESGKTIQGTDIRLMRGGFVVGTLFDASQKPFVPSPEHPTYVAHYGPARPRTGAAVTSTAVNADGTYRLRVAPGRNYVYLMGGDHAEYVDVEDGQEVRLDFPRPGQHAERVKEFREADEDVELRRRLMELQRIAKANSEALSDESDVKPTRSRRDTPTGRLLDKLEKQNRYKGKQYFRRVAFTDPWCRTLKDVVDLGPAAVPELVDELDATQNGLMIGCLAFTLRAIGDKRSVPALIRAIPKTLQRGGSDMGCMGYDAQLVQFMQQHDLDEQNEKGRYHFHRSVREVFGTLRKLTGQSFDEERLFHVFFEGVPAQKRQQKELFDDTARKWATWWEQHWSDHVQDSAYSRVNFVATPIPDEATPAEKQGESSPKEKTPQPKDPVPDSEETRRKLNKEFNEKLNDEALSGEGDAGPIILSRSRPDTPTGRLLDKLEKQNRTWGKGDNMRTAAYTDGWCRTLKEIVDVGPAAVPELIEELDATSNERMFRCLGFVLRAINDKRAVPALIRATPRTLLPATSGMGCVSDDPELRRFMQQHDLVIKNVKDEYSISGPVAEIFGALRKLTGQTFDEEGLFSVSLGGVPSQRFQQRWRFDATARKWADWWEAHWLLQVSDAWYGEVRLVRSAHTEPAKALDPRTRLEVSMRHSNHVVQPVTDPASTRVFYDLDTGVRADLPVEWREAKNIESKLDEILAWAARKGYDIMGVEYVSPNDGSRTKIIRPIGLRAWELSPDRWKMTIDGATFEQLQAEGRPVDDLLLHYDEKTKSYDAKGTAPFLIITREGAPVILYLGIEVQDTNVKPGERPEGDDQLRPSAFRLGRRFGWATLEEAPALPK